MKKGGVAAAYASQQMLLLIPDESVINAGSYNLG